MVHKVPMTVRGSEKLRQELKKLKYEIRPKIIEAIAEARQHGDLKENAEYHAAREQQSFCEGRIKKIEEKLFHAQIIDIKNISNHEIVVFGATVTILNLDEKKLFVYTIVGDDEADCKKRFISVNSPMSRGLIGKKINEVAVINTPSKKVEYLILKIEYI